MQNEYTALMQGFNAIRSSYIFSHIATHMSILTLGSLPLVAHSQVQDTDRCTTATAQVERALRLPDGFLSAMSRIETGRPQSQGRLAAWPWSINVDGVGHQYSSMKEAVDAVKGFQQAGVKSIDIGCLQVNIMFHPDAFSSIEAAFDPYTNALYAGHFLQQMHDKTGSWPRAAAAYHSQTPGIGEAYLWRVLEEWAVPQDNRPVLPPRITPPHPVSTPRMLTRPHGNTPQGTQNSLTSASGNRLFPHSFKPFQGFQRFSAPPNHPHISSAQKGRDLASYRATPVRMVGAMPSSSY